MTGIAPTRPVVVGVAASGGPDALARSLASILEHTPVEVPVIVAAGDDQAAREAVAGLGVARPVESVSGGPAELAAATAPADLALVDGRHLVGPGWLDGLRAALAQDSTIATASALTTARGPTAPANALRRPADAGEAARMAAAVAGRAARLRPRIERPGGCALIRREALELAGPLDDGFAARCASHALLHVAADEVLAAELDPLPPQEPTPEIPEFRAARIHARSPLERSLALARRAVDGLSVTIDGRALIETLAGTQVHTLELIAALHRTGAAGLRVVLPPNAGETALELLRSLDGVELLDANDVDEDLPRSTVVHRPYQVSGPEDLGVLWQLGERLVVTHQDLLNYHDPAYHRDREGWLAHRRLTREALAAADAVVTFSPHAAADLDAEDLVPRDRHRTIPIGVDHILSRLEPEPRAPAGAAAIGDRPYLLCIGSDLLHKNRRFALELLERLREAHGWNGALVLAGPHVEWGASDADERAFLDARPGLADAVVTLPQVDEPGKAWLYGHSAGVLYPTTYEGFGLIPFEAARAGVPCFFAPRAALRDTLPVELALLVEWDAGRSAERIAGALGDDARSAALVEGIAAAAAPLTWDRAAASLLELYEDVVAARPREQAALAHTAMVADDRRGHFEGLYWQLHGEIGPTGHALVGADGLLDEDAQRAIAALTRRGATRRPFLAALRLLHRLGGRSQDGR